jgi:hypothetical protein
LPEGTEFVINEYDGSETLEIKSDIVWHKAWQTSGNIV